MTDRFRIDLERDLGHAPSDQECYEALEDRIGRLRVSVGEYD